MTPSGIGDVTFRFVVQCLNELRHCMPHLLEGLNLNSDDMLQGRC